MRTLVVLLAFVLCLGGLPAEAQDAAHEQGLKVYVKVIRAEKRFMIYLSNLDGSGERELVEGFWPSLSPNQKHVVFVRDGLMLLDLDTMEEKTLLSGEEANLLFNRGPANPHWHPNGRTIFVTVQSSGEQDWREGRGRCYEGTTEGVGGNSEGAGCWRTAAWQALRR